MTAQCHAGIKYIAKANSLTGIIVEFLIHDFKAVARLDVTLEVDLVRIKLDQVHQHRDRNTIALGGQKQALLNRARGNITRRSQFDFVRRSLIAVISTRDRNDGFRVRLETQLVKKFDIVLGVCCVYKIEFLSGAQFARIKDIAQRFNCIIGRCALKAGGGQCRHQVRSLFKDDRFTARFNVGNTGSLGNRGIAVHIEAFGSAGRQGRIRGVGIMIG